MARAMGDDPDWGGAQRRPAPAPGHAKERENGSATLDSEQNCNGAHTSCAHSNVGGGPPRRRELPNPMVCPRSRGSESERERSRRRQWQVLKQTTVRRTLGAGRAVIFLSLLLVGLWVGGAEGGDEDKLERARLEFGDVFSIRKALSGESTFPHRYRSHRETSRQCCGGIECVECGGEELENLQVAAAALRREIRVLETLGCPCKIGAIAPKLGPAAGGTKIILEIDGMDLNLAFSYGEIECWFSREVEQYIKVPAVKVQPAQVRMCDSLHLIQYTERSFCA